MQGLWGRGTSSKEVMKGFEYGVYGLGLLGREVCANTPSALTLVVYIPL